LTSQLSGYNIIPLHSELPIDEQRQVLNTPDKPTIVVATNIAQESITLDYINAVVDNGYCKILKVNPN
jgi:HrpA-like RNA helicase